MVVLAPDLSGFGKSTRIIVFTIVYGNSFPVASFTYSILNPPSKSFSRPLISRVLTLSPISPVAIFFVSLSLARIF